MRKFLYLRMVAITTLVTLVSYMIYFLYRYPRNILWYDWKQFVLNEITMALFMTNSLSVLFIYYKYYPAKEISKTSIRFYWFSFVLACLWIGIMVAAFFSMIIFEMNRRDDGLADNARHWQMFISLALSGLVVVQMIGGRRMIKTIRQNARQLLENSFA